MSLATMSDTTRVRIGRVFAVAAIGLSLGGILRLVLTGRWDALVESGALNLGWLGLGLGALTWVMVSSQPRNGAVWVVAWAGVFAALYTAGLASALILAAELLPDLSYEAFRSLSPADLSRPAAFALLFRFWAVVPALWLPLTLGLLLFPDGSPPTPQWKWVGWWSVAAITVATVATAIAQSPWSTEPISSAEGTLAGPIGVVIDVAFLLAGVSALVSAASLVVRYRQSAGATRRQIRWIGWSGALLVVFVFLNPLIEEAGPASLRSALIGLVASSLLIGAYGIAIMRYRLYDIDLIINKTFLYGSLVVVISAVFAAIVMLPFVVLGVGDATSVGQLLLPLAATVVLVVVFQPVRARLQRGANRLTYGRRATPYEALSEFSATVAGSFADEDLLDRMAAILAEGTGAEGARVWVVSGSVLREAASFPSGGGAGDTHLRLVGGGVPDIPGADAAAAVTHHGELLGALSLSKKQGESMRPIEQQLLQDLASHAGVVLRNFRLNEELLARLDELQASRQRLVSAQDEERRKLERNLHDGAQQQLVALKIKLGLLRMIDDEEKRNEVAAGLATDLDDAIDSLRDLARGIYPPTLAQEGLVAALRGQAAKAAVATRVDASGVARYSPDVEAAVYFCTLEAMQNIAKYAGADQTQVRLVGSNGTLRFEVTDDGRGFETTTTDRGAGLQNMEDRVEALGGTVEVASIPGAGTSITGLLPASPRQPAGN